SPKGAMRTQPLMPKGATMRPRTIMRTASGSLRGLLDQAGHRVGDLGAVLHPVLKALGVDHDGLFLVGSDRVEVTDALDEAAVTTVALVGCDDVEKGALLGATTGKTNDDHG